MVNINTTQWSPDTCDCIIEYQWDRDLPADQRVHILSRYVNRCAIHAVQADDTTRWNTILEENPRKNQALQLIIDNAPLSFVDINTNPDSSTYKTLKAGLSLSVSVSGTPPNRVFTLTLISTTLTQTQKNAVQNALNTRFGTGKVIFVN